MLANGRKDPGSECSTDLRRKDKDLFSYIVTIPVMIHKRNNNLWPLGSTDSTFPHRPDDLSEGSLIMPEQNEQRQNNDNLAWG